MSSCWRCRRAAHEPAAGPEGADRIPRHRERAFPLRAAGGRAPILGVVGGLVEWLFAFPQRLSVTISNADRLVDMPREELAQAIWGDVCKAAGVTGELPPLADRARAPRHIRGYAGAECAAPGHGHRVEKPVPRRRLDRYGIARNHRGIGAVGDARPISFCPASRARRSDR